MTSTLPARLSASADADPDSDPIDDTSLPGSPTAAIDLYRLQWNSLVVLATGLVGDRAAGEDVVQDVFESICRRRPQFDTDAQGTGYLRAAVIRRSRHVHRQRFIRRRHQRIEQAVGETAAGVIDPTHLDVLQAVAGLGRREREVVVLRYWLDLSITDTAVTLDSSVSTVRSVAARALAHLAARLDNDHAH